MKLGVCGSGIFQGRLDDSIRFWDRSGSRLGSMINFSTFPTRRDRTFQTLNRTTQKVTDARDKEQPVTFWDWSDSGSGSMIIFCWLFEFIFAKKNIFLGIDMHSSECYSSFSVCFFGVYTPHHIIIPRYAYASRGKNLSSVVRSKLTAPLLISLSFIFYVYYICDWQQVSISSRYAAHYNNVMMMMMMMMIINYR